MIASPGTASITVTNSAGTSASFPFTITPAGVLTISALSPAAVYPTGQTFTIIVSGSGFTSGTVLQWNGLALDSGVDSPTTLHATIPGNYIAKPGSSSLQAVYPNGLTSAPAYFEYATKWAPTITAISPNTAVAGSQPVTVKITGTNFNTRSVAMSSSANLSTSFISSTQLNAIVPADQIANPGSFWIQVQNPEGAKSSIINFSVSNAPPVLNGLSPATATAGDGAFTLAVNGTNFLSGAAVQWNGTPVTTTYLSKNQVTASIPAALVATAGTASVTVLNADKLLSNALAFIINPRSAVLTGLTPSSATAGGPGFVLTATGSDFPSGSVILWNGTALNTNFVSSSQLTAPVAAALIAATGTAAISVSAGKSTTASLSFSITPVLPASSPLGIVNAFSSTTSIAPGSLISIYGSSLAAANSAAASAPLPNNLGGTSVSINNIPVPLLFVSPGQINGQVPFEVSAGNATMVIQQNGLKSLPVTIQIQATAPGILTVGQTNHALAVNLPDYTLNSAQQPATPGQYVTLYLTGQGAVDQPVSTGSAASSDPLAKPLASVSATVGDTPAEVQFAGLAPGFVGLLQVNIKVPVVSAGEQPLQVRIGTTAAQQSVLSVGAEN